MSKKTKNICTGIAIFLAIVLITLFDRDVIGNAYVKRVLNLAAIYAIISVSMNLVNGFTGLFSLGQAGFMAIGAFSVAIFTVPAEYIDSIFYLEPMAPWLAAIRLPFVAALLVGGLIAAGLSLLIGYPVLRLKSDYLAIATLGFSEIIRAVFSSPQMDTITNGSYGLNKVPTFPKLFGLPVLFTPFIIAAVCIALMVLLINSTYGRAFKAIREDEIAAEAMGVNLFKHKQLSFVISSFFTAISGGLLAMFMRSIEAKTFSITLTYDILLIVVIGGIGSVTGSVLSAFLVTASKEWWLRFFDQPLIIGGWEISLFRTGFRMVVFSVLLMVVVLFYRRGLMGDKEFSWDGLVRLLKKPFARRVPAGVKGGAGHE
mgnify:CR=1 FL=1